MDSLSYFFSKAIRLLISPDFFLVLLLFISFVTYRYRKFSRGLFAVVLIFLVTLTFFPVGEWLIYPLESRYKSNPTLPTNVDGVIMLSGGEEVLLSRAWNQIEFDKAVERNIYFLAFIREYPNAKFVYSGGGLPRYKGYSKELMEKFIAKFGLDSSNVIFDLKSKNTLENVKNSYATVIPQKNERWVVVTSAWHMPRAKLLFDRYNWKVIPFPVDHLSQKGNLFRFKINFSENLSVFKIAIKEWIGIIVYRFYF